MREGRAKKLKDAINASSLCLRAMGSVPSISFAPLLIQLMDQVLTVPAVCVLFPFPCSSRFLKSPLGSRPSSGRSEQQLQALKCTAHLLHRKPLEGFAVS